ncbi:MAG: bifunctional diaminohydroxyphosphoribosylaminopyrimidine deaminase/5-amino-6-(5-phosphoribosylamino)uracil reductase RibD [Bdellovibrionota bacterium]
MATSRAPEELMRYALAEAYLSTRDVRPNPRVGCALETTTGELVYAHHERVGEAHAEKRVLDLCRERGLDTRGARVAVTLEPCSHHGRTAPCADALIAARVAEVFVAVEDPFPLVRGKGIEKLRAAGIKTEIGVLADKAENLNREWLFAHRNGRAHATLKMATSWDGGWRSSSGDSQWITSEEARLKAQQLRTRVDAIVTGASTVRADDPQLTARKHDGSLLPHQPQVFVFTRNPSSVNLEGTRLASHPKTTEIWSGAGPHVFLKECYDRGLYDVMIESGPTLAQVFLESHCVDEIWSFTETQFLGGASTLHFPQAFNKGALPGLYFQIRDLEALGSTSVFTLLSPVSKI